MKRIQGLRGARGQAVGKCVISKDTLYKIERKEADDPCREVEKLETARKDYCKELEHLYENSAGEIGKASADIVLAYQEIVKDDIFFGKCTERVQKEKINIEYVLEEEKKRVIQLFCGMKDPYMKDRGADIEHVCNALIKKMLGVTDVYEKTDGIEEAFILIAKDLAPTDTIRLDKTYLKGLVTEKGGQTSHTVILAKALGIPAVVGAVRILEQAAANDIICINGETGEVIVQPEEGILDEYIKMQNKAEEQDRIFRGLEKEKAETKDGHVISICLNAGDKEGMEKLDMSVCDGIGLFRTEFIYMSAKQYPSEQMQFQIYKALAEKAEGKEVVIRTLDIGGDKQIDYMELPPEANPFLGHRAIRICLERKEIFKTQLRAILEASAFGTLSIMFPMIVSIEELRAAKQLLEECKGELEEKGILYDKEIKTGIMIETPAAVLLSDRLAEEADFFSIGTNDLIQYMTASDRMNEKVQNLYRICNISVLRAIKMTVENAHKAGIKVSMCGEAASDEKMVPVWLGIGIDKLSMVRAQTARIKYMIRHFSIERAKDIAAGVFEMDRVEDIEKYLEEMNLEKDSGVCYDVKGS